VPEPKLVLYGLMILCYILAGLLDINQGQTKLGVTALMFAICNYVIFFWRT